MPKRKLLPKEKSTLIKIRVDRPSELQRFDITKSDAQASADYEAAMFRWEAAKAEAVAEMQSRLEHISRNFFRYPENFTGTLEGKTQVLWMIAREFVPGLRTSWHKRGKGRTVPEGASKKLWNAESVHILRFEIAQLRERNPSLSEIAACRALIKSLRKKNCDSILKSIVLRSHARSTTDDGRARTLANLLSDFRKRPETN